MAWLDTGTFDSLHEASSYIRTLEHIQGLKACCPEEIVWRKGWIDDNQLKELANRYGEDDYGNYLLKLISKLNFQSQEFRKILKNFFRC